MLSFTYKSAGCSLRVDEKNCLKNYRKKIRVWVWWSSSCKFRILFINIERITEQAQQKEKWFIRYFFFLYRILVGQIVGAEGNKTLLKLTQVDIGKCLFSDLTSFFFFFFYLPFYSISLYFWFLFLSLFILLSWFSIFLFSPTCTSFPFWPLLILFLPLVFVHLTLFPFH